MVSRARMSQVSGKLLGGLKTCGNQAILLLCTAVVKRPTPGATHERESERPTIAHLTLTWTEIVSVEKAPWSPAVRASWRSSITCRSVPPQSSPRSNEEREKYVGFTVARHAQSSKRQKFIRGRTSFAESKPVTATAIATHHCSTLQQ